MTDDPSVQTPPPPPETPGTLGSGIPAEERQWAMFAHLSALLGGLVTAGWAFSIGCFLGPLIIWLMKRETMPFVADQAKEALNFNITLAAIMLVLLLVGVLTLGIGFLIAGMILQAGFTLVSAKLLLLATAVFFTWPVVTHALAQVCLHEDIHPTLAEDRREMARKRIEKQDQELKDAGLKDGGRRPSN